MSTLMPRASSPNRCLFVVRSIQTRIDCCRPVVCAGGASRMLGSTAAASHPQSSPVSRVGSAQLGVSTGILVSAVNLDCGEPFSAQRHHDLVHPGQHLPRTPLASSAVSNTRPLRLGESRTEMYFKNQTTRSRASSRVLEESTSVNQSTRCSVQSSTDGVCTCGGGSVDPGTRKLSTTVYTLRWNFR